MAEQHLHHPWSTGQTPDDWRMGIILPFWKRKCDALICTNNRGITLLSIPVPTFARVIVHHQRRSHQAGFMPGLRSDCSLEMPPNCEYTVHSL